MKEEINLVHRKVNRSAHREVQLFLHGKKNEWERCLRFKYQKNCTNTSKDAPPCVIDLLKEMSLNLFEILNEEKLDYWLSFGTLLGAIRNEKLINWTDDVDISMDSVVFDSVQEVLIKSKKLKKLGYFFFIDPKYKGIARVCLTEESKFGKFEIYEVEKKTI